MIFPIFWLLFINVGIQSITARAEERSTLPLCCPGHGWKLARISRGLFRSDDYTCIPPPLMDNLTEPLNDAVLAFDKSSPLFGYGVLEPKEHESNFSIPTCERRKYVEYTVGEDFEIPPNSCIMGIADELIAAISCPPTNEDSLQAFRFIHKCCPNNYIYDSTQRKCIEAAANYHLYKNLFPNKAIFKANTLACPRDKVLVEYQLNEFKFSIDDGELFLRNLNKKFAFPQYCIEAVVQSPALDNPSQSSIMLRREQQFLVRTCDDMLTVCRRMPCIRRCCSDGEMFTKGNATSYCRRDESDTTYHSFESLEISGNFTKPPGR